MVSGTRARANMQARRGARLRSVQLRGYSYRYSSHPLQCHLVADRGVLLHEMVHQALSERGVSPKHADQPWRDEISRLHLILTGQTDHSQTAEGNQGPPGGRHPQVDARHDAMPDEDYLTQPRSPAGRIAASCPWVSSDRGRPTASERCATHTIRRLCFGDHTVCRNELQNARQIDVQRDSARLYSREHLRARVASGQ